MGPFPLSRLHRYGSGDSFAPVSKILRFRRRWRLKRPSDSPRMSFVGRLKRMKEQRKLQWHAMVAGALVVGALGIYLVINARN